MRVFIYFVLAISVVYGKVAPDGFPACKRNDPNIDKCFRDGIEAIRPLLKAGIPNINIPPIEPFSVPTLRLDRTAPNLRLKAVIKNMKALGGGDFRLDKFRIKLDKGYAADLKLYIPRLSVAGDYDVQGSRLLVLDISGKGKLKSNFTGITVVAKGSAKPIVKDDVTYLQADKIVTKIRISNGELDVDDTERPVAAASAVAFFNSNPKVVLDILSPIIEDSAAAILKAFINKILGSIPMNELLLDD